MTKSDYLLYLKHPCWLWLKKNNPKKLPAPNDNLQAIFEAGYLFESYAEKLFPNGLKLNWRGFEEYLNLPQRTKETILSGAKTIFQGRFETGEITCIVDVIDFKDEKILNLYEIKSTSSIKPYQEHDLAFQTIVLEESGYAVDRIFIIHVNSEYVRKGEIIPKELSKTVDVTAKIRKRIEATRENIKKALEVAEQKEMPNPTPALCGLSCIEDWLEIYKPMAGIKKGDGSIYDIYKPNATLIGKLEEAGIEKLSDIPIDFPALSEKQQWQVKVNESNEIFQDKKKLEKFIKKIKYPLYFLDYETLSSVVPYFDGHRPYQQIPFQYSLHVITQPGARPRHFEYLHSEKSDPTKPLTESLASNIGPAGTILVWWESFEKNCNTIMGEMLPKYQKFYENLNNRIIDLIEPFYNFYYVDKKFGGSSSIKDVLPVLVPELSYKELGISEGNTAQRLWMEAILDGKRDGEKEKILRDLWDYCKLDTLAMVKIWEFLQSLKP